MIYHLRTLTVAAAARIRGVGRPDAGPDDEYDPTADSDKPLAPFPALYSPVWPSPVAKLTPQLEPLPPHTHPARLACAVPEPVDPLARVPHPVRQLQAPCPRPPPTHQPPLSACAPRVRRGPPGSPAL